jgi:lipoprotein-releasing system permease protein
MRFTLFMAKRYLFSGKRTRAVHIITAIAISGMCVGTAALILVLSVFNGFQDLLEKMYGAIDPDIRIEASTGRGILTSDELRYMLSQTEGIELVTATLEGKAAIDYQGIQRIVRIKGVEEGFTKLNAFKKAITDGVYKIHYSDTLITGIAGLGLANMTGLRLNDYFTPPVLTVVPDKIKPGSSPEKAIRQMHFLPVAFFSFQKEYDDNWVILPLPMIQNLMGFENTITAYELKIKDKFNREAIRKNLQNKLGPEFKVKTKFEVHEDIYRVMKNEKFAGYLILTLMLIIAGTNIVGSLAVIVIEKQKDIAILKAMGASRGQIRNIFISSGLMTGFIGVCSGILLAFLVGYSQMQWGWLGIEGGESFAVDAYPMRLEIIDFILVGLTVIVLSFLASLGPAYQAARFTVTEGLKR